MANITVEGKSYMVYAVITHIVDDEIQAESIKVEFPARDSRGAQKAIAKSYKVRAKDVNVIKIETVKKSVSFAGDFDEFVKACGDMGFEQITD